MSPRRVVVLMAIMAALAGAPSSVSAAAPNQLSQASVVPLSGDTSTLFVVSVRYRSPAGNAATSVSINVGGEVTVMTLIAGTATDGVWRGTIHLAAGTWDVSVQASVAEGAQPSLSAGTVSVAGATEPTTPPGGSIPSSTAGLGSAGSGVSSTPAPAPATTPAPRTAATPAPAPDRSTVVVAPSQAPTGPVSSGAAPAGPVRRGEAPTRSPRAHPGDRSAAAQRSATPSATVGGTPAPSRGDGDLGMLMVVGTLAVGLVALVGSAWILMAGRRDRRAAALAGGAPVTDPGVRAAAIAGRRALRRARLRSADDPILAAMGLPDEDAAPGAGGVNDRPPSSRTRRRSPKR